MSESIAQKCERLQAAGWQPPHREVGTERAHSVSAIRPVASSSWRAWRHRPPFLAVAWPHTSGTERLSATHYRQQ